ncbi:CUE domain-containing protein 2 [Chelonoidis abingdonii]|uniref:CUE domain containing 2 n=1 Tax=Chelonoidis abingdonii TaxID=106734 RepID=A0A8C0GH73_CHEAB|nr:CUE domain-containing protein 2 [Chelonoidis abingdonii]XP_032634134.1 CUE domain-containing protein 2 [Chelonoidis abingdonii]XP_032634136.1 CUE domain-containing protein 2 [Chelonoidis abingdonii]XP_032634137.1 CUE domain-containing protein 2 [Chelonoidis abingdonii]XP_032634138.1 CUE domain-containing protein 2 [Chelonoidis abingdonii]XP_032634139.1 CUE domain-containing protein 2 [Chelonoidis abingdonii]XP_032634140.1 CUE domain-containing protein 2 [Chelonoidis abingdonii]XP_03263414
MDVERIIQDSLTCFIQSHIPDADLSGMDEVVFSYIASVLEELGSPESSEENFDMDAFVEMMEAYIPGFAEINSGNICEMMFALSERLSEAHNKGKVCQKAVESMSRAPAEELNQSKEQGEGASDERRLHIPAEGAIAQGAEGDLKDRVELLLEMFPACTLSQAQKALAMVLGNLEEAVQLLVEEKVEPGPGGANLKETARPHQAPKQEDLKRFILQKYMMVDSEEDQKTHRPVPPKEAPKKLIRYIDNQVVSTKGERYKDIKKPESEEMKRTYISLKPAKKYKFH